MCEATEVSNYQTANIQSCSSEADGIEIAKFYFLTGPDINSSSGYDSLPASVNSATWGNAAIFGRGEGRAKKTLVLSGLGGDFAVLTTCNPCGRTVDEATNARRTEDLEKYMQFQGLAFLKADGVSPDRQHREPGFAVSLTLDKATCIAKHFDQCAFFWFDGKEFSIMPAVLQAKQIPLPKYSHGGKLGR